MMRFAAMIGCMVDLTLAQQCPPYRGGIRLGNAMRTLKSYLFLSPPPLLPIGREVWQSLSPKFKGGSEHVESLWKWDEV